LNQSAIAKICLIQTLNLCGD